MELCGLSISVSLTGVLKLLDILIILVLRSQLSAGWQWGHGSAVEKLDQEELNRKLFNEIKRAIR